MRIFDTKQRGYCEFEPPPTVRMYVCGITPYDSAHIGHIFTFMTYDLLQRRFEDLGSEVTMVRNITDVDEPMYSKAAELGIPYTELAIQETAKFQKTMGRLNFRPATFEPTASHYILQMAEAVSRLIKSGHAYFVDSDVYFDISKQPEFGKVACFTEKLRMGLFKNRGGDPDRPGKRQPMDFLLWKAVPEQTDPAAWKVGNGLPKGRPGWHIECTVMSSDLLGVPFDIHGGGTDLIFPHHEAEIAQSRALDDVSPAGRWVHTAPLYYGGEKMSKSLGNLVFAAGLLTKYSPDAIRLALMHYHYREGGEWTPELLDEATDFLPKLATAINVASLGAGHTLLDAVRVGLDDDLDTHAILHSLADCTKAKAGNGKGAGPARQALDLLGLQLPQK